MKNDYKYTIRMAALAMVGAAITACSSIDDDEQAAVPAAGKTVVLTGKLANKAGDMTRAFTVVDNGTQPKSSWEEGETVAIRYQKSDDSYATATATIKNEEGDFEATLTDPKAGDVKLVYPATRHDGQGSYSTEGIGRQDGTVQNISDNWDIVTGQGTMTVGKDSAKIGEAQMKPQLSICRCVLKDMAEAQLTATQLDIAVIAAGDATAYSVTRTAEASDTFYVAMVPVEGATLTFSTTVGEKAYTKTTENAVTLAKGTFYPITVMMEEKPVTDLSMVDCAGNARTDGRWTANCYMVHTAGDYKLPLVYGNAIEGGQTNAAAYTGVAGDNTTATFPRHDGEAITGPWIKDNGITVTQAEVLWQDAEDLITKVGIEGDSLLTLTVGKSATEQEGNALVAAKTADGTIVWSWHIWVTKETFATLTSVNTGSQTYSVTPVNLGWVSATGTNTFYQWGRKDPFIGTGDVNYSTNSATIADNIKNPETFYNKSEMPNNASFRNLWDAEQTSKGNIVTPTKKTVYDPSPAGFCVPTSNLFYYIENGSAFTFAWDGTNKGRNLVIGTSQVFFPASGSRRYSNGSLTDEDVYGNCWSSSADSDSNGHLLNFDSQGRCLGSNYRSSGIPVRAVAEEAPSSSDGKPAEFFGTFQ